MTKENKNIETAFNLVHEELIKLKKEFGELKQRFEEHERIAGLHKEEF